MSGLQNWKFGGMIWMVFDEDVGYGFYDTRIE